MKLESRNLIKIQGKHDGNKIVVRYFILTIFLSMINLVD